MWSEEGRAWLTRTWMDPRGFLERYFELLREGRVRGYLFEQQNYVPKTE